MTTSKKTLFVVSDAAIAPTGFGRVAEAVLDRLYESGEWSIKQLGINYFDQDHDKPYRIFAATGTTKGDWLGTTRIKPLYDEIKPDATWLFQDFWHISSYVMASPEMRGLVTYYPVDSPNIKPQWAMAQAAAVEVCTYTEFGVKETVASVRAAMDKIVESARAQGKEEIRLINTTNGKEVLNLSVYRLNELLNPASYNIIPHGINRLMFHPEDKRLAKESINLDPDTFVVGNVNRNQSRKRQDLTIRGFAKFAKGKDNVRLLLHDPLKTYEGWDLQQLAEYYGVADKVLVSVSNYDTAALNRLYNAIDVMVNTGGGEGWGLTAVESACCKVAQIVPDWSATKEIWSGSGLLLDVISVRHEPNKINTAQCVISDDHLVEHLENLYRDPALLKKVADDCYDAMQTDDYNWDTIATTFHKIFESAIEKNVVEPLPLRIDDVFSE